MLLVNDSLKFTSSDTQICWNFLLKKLLPFFQQKNQNIVYWIRKTVNEMTLNGLVKVTMLWPTGPSNSNSGKESKKIFLRQNYQKARNTTIEIARVRRFFVCFFFFFFLFFFLFFFVCRILNFRVNILERNTKTLFFVIRSWRGAPHHVMFSCAT